MFRLLLPLLFLPVFVCAQSASAGWEKIHQNDFVAARTAFEATLSRQPGNEDALVGLMFLAETVQDEEAYERSAKRLLTTWRPEYVWLLGHLDTGDPALALQELRNSGADKHPGLALPFLWRQADSLFRHRRFEESNALRRQTLPDWNWSLTGPFSNVAGSGFVETTPVETTDFDAKAVFKNEEGTDFGWVKRTTFAPGSPVSFDVLPPPLALGTYYANTFLTVSAPFRAAFLLTRQAPIKIWLDGQLLASFPKPLAPNQWDAERIEVDLPAGTHRLLLKVSDFPENNQDSRIRLGFKDQAQEIPAGYNYDEDERDYSPDEASEDNSFTLRLVAVGSVQPSPLVRSDFEGKWTAAAHPWRCSLHTDEWLGHFLQAAQQNPDDLTAAYLLTKAFNLSGKTEEGEAYFSKYLKQHRDQAFARFLLAKFYDANGKGERAEALLSELDTLRTPTFAGYHVRLMKINKEENEGEYVSTLEKILALSPTNWAMMSRYLHFLQDKGRKEQVKNYVSRFLEEKEKAAREQDADEAKKYLNKWKKRLEPFQEDESYKPESYTGKSDKEREKEFKKAQKALKNIWSPSNYSTLLGYYRFKDKQEDVLRTYTEMLTITPWATHVLEQKANYLFEKERFKEAEEAYQRLIVLEPYDGQLLEKMGDLYIELKQEPEALRWYKKAAEINSHNEDYSLRGKLEKLENRKKYNGYFKSVSLEEAAKDRQWQNRYRDEESVISHFYQQLTYLPEARKLEGVKKAVIHILSEAGAKKWTEADLRPIGRVSSAKVLKKDGTVTSPDLGWGVAVFKNLQAGDIILLEGAYEQTMPDDISGEFLELNTLSWQAPVAQSSLEVLLPKDFPLYVAANRLSPKYEQRDTAEYKCLRWEWNDIAKIEESEDGTPENYDPYAWIMLGNAPDWGKVVQWYLRQTYCRTEPNYEVLEQARQLLKPGMSETEVVETLHTFITKEINYSYVPFLNNNYVPKKPGATLSGKVGDCKDVATLMISLLRDQGIPAWYTLVSTHSFSNNEPRPTIYVFNHAIVAWESKDKQIHFADLTTDYFPTGVLPESDCGAWGLVIRAGENQLRRLPADDINPKVSAMRLTVKADLDTDGTLLMQADIERQGTAAGHWREMLLRATPEDRNKALSEYFGGGVLNHTDLEKIQFLNPEDLNAPLRATATIRAYKQLDKVSNLFIMPLPLPLSTPTQKALFAAKRYNDLDLDRFFEMAPVTETVELTLPPTLQLAEMPENREVSSRFGHYTLRFEKTTSGLRLYRTVRFDLRFINHADFPDFKKFYSDMLDADDVLLALKR